MPNLSYVKKRKYRTFLILNTEQNQQNRQYRRKKRKGFRRFWLEKTDNTDNFLRLKTEDFSTRVVALNKTKPSQNHCKLHAVY